MPFWNPFYEGGFPWFTYPDFITFNPVSLFMLLFGVVLGANFSWYIFFFVGGLSMFYLTRYVLKYETTCAFYSSLVFSMSGFFAYMHMLSFWCRDTFLLPLLIAAFIKSFKDSRYIILASLILAQLLFSMLFFPVILLFLFLFAIFQSVKSGAKGLFFEKKYLFDFLCVLLLALLFSAFKIIPMLEFLSIDQRISGLIYESSIEQANTGLLFLRRLLAPENLNVGTMYMGLLPVTLCLLTSIVFFKKVKSWVWLLCVFIILSFGPNSLIDLHKIFWHLPVFRSIREISKYYALIIIFIISLLSGRFFSFIKMRFSKKIAAILSIVVILLTFGDLLWANIGYFNRYNTDLDLRIQKNFISHVKNVNIHKGNEGGIASLKLALRINGFGLMNAQYHKFEKYFQASNVNPEYFIMPEYVFMAPSTKMFVLSNPGYKKEVWFLNSRNKAEDFSITNKNIIFNVVIEEPDRLVINQRYFRGWYSDQGMVEDYKGLLSLKLNNKGTYQVKLYFVPLSFYIGLTISLISLCCAFMFLMIISQKKLPRLF